MVFSGHISREGKEYVYKCPLCGHNKLKWDPKRKAGRCWGCPGHPGYGIKTMSALLNHRLDVSMACLPDVELRELSPREARHKKVVLPATRDDMMWWYLEQERRIKREWLQDVPLWYEEETDRVHFPLRPKVGLDPWDNGITMSRICDPDQKGWWVSRKDKELHWYHNLWRIPDTLVLVEGIFDVLTPNLQDCAIALLGTKLYEIGEYWLVENALDKEVLVWLDDDEPGKLAAKQICSLLTCLGIRWRNIDAKEPGSCTPEEARGILNGQ